MRNLDCLGSERIQLQAIDGPTLGEWWNLDTDYLRDGKRTQDLDFCEDRIALGLIILLDRKILCLEKVAGRNGLGEIENNITPAIERRNILGALDKLIEAQS